MTVRDDLSNMVDKLKVQRDEINLKLHLASMEVKDEYDEAEKKWQHVKSSSAQFADKTKEATEDAIEAAKVIAEELKETYKRISKRLSD